MGTVTAWQNHRDRRAKEEFTTSVIVHDVEDLSRGMVCQGSAADVASRWNGVVDLDFVSFTSRDWVADAFAQLDDIVAPGSCRVKLFLTSGRAAAVHLNGDPTYDFEAEHLVVGSYLASSEVVTDQLVIVELTPAHS